MDPMGKGETMDVGNPHQWRLVIFHQILRQLVLSNWPSVLKMASTVPRRNIVSGSSPVASEVSSCMFLWLPCLGFLNVVTNVVRSIKEIKGTLLYHTLSYMRSSVSE